MRFGATLSGADYRYMSLPLLYSKHTQMRRYIGRKAAYKNVRRIYDTKLIETIINVKNDKFIQNLMEHVQSGSMDEEGV